MEGIHQLAPGSVFAGYQIMKPLGAGGFGAVYLARHPNLNKLVALKVLDFQTSDEQARKQVEQKFRGEADLLAQLDEHENIVTVFDRDTTNGVMWIAMRYIAGVDCDKAVSAGPLSPERAVRVIADVADALSFAHQHGVVHRDVKPSNILLVTPPDGSERAMLTDFGIAKVLAETQIVGEQSAIMVSPPCAAPEQFEGVGIDHRADIYGLGCTLYILITGAAPYAGAGGYLQTAEAHKNAPIPKPSEIAGVPVGFDAVIAKALAKEPAQRYDSATELAAAAHGALVQDVVDESQVRQKPSKLRKRLLLTGGAVGLCAAAAAILWFVNRPVPPPPVPVGSPAYTATEERLFGVLPVDYNKMNCSRASISAGYAAVLHCTGNLATGVPEARFFLVDAQHVVRDQFNNAPTGGSRYACMRGAPQPQPITTNGRTTGLLTCYSEGSNPRVMWTNDADRVIALAYGRPNGIQALIQWWKSRGTIK